MRGVLEVLEVLEFHILINFGRFGYPDRRDRPWGTESEREEGGES